MRFKTSQKSVKRKATNRSYEVLLILSHVTSGFRPEAHIHALIQSVCLNLRVKISEDSCFCPNSKGMFSNVWWLRPSRFLLRTNRGRESSEPCSGSASQAGCVCVSCGQLSSGSRDEMLVEMTYRRQGQLRQRAKLVTVRITLEKTSDEEMKHAFILFKNRKMDRNRLKRLRSLLDHHRRR